MSSPTVKPTVTLVTDSSCNFQGLYYDGKLVADLGDNATAKIDRSFWTVEDALDELLFKIGVPFESISGWQLSRKIVGFDYTEFESYWPDNLADVPPDERTYGPEDDVRTDGDN